MLIAESKYILASGMELALNSHLKPVRKRAGIKINDAAPRKLF